MKSCEGCKYWSELVAQSIGLGPLEAMCLCKESVVYQHMVHMRCSCYDPGVPVDIVGTHYEREYQ